MVRDRQNREMPISLSPEMSRQVQVGDMVEAQVDANGQVTSISKVPNSEVTWGGAALRGSTHSVQKTLPIHLFVGPDRRQIDPEAFQPHDDGQR